MKMTITATFLVVALASFDSSYPVHDKYRHLVED